MATHVPLMGKNGFVSAVLLQADLYPYSTYALSATVAKQQLPEGLFWDLAIPYYYLRVDSGRTHDTVIFGGADHKTGQSEDTRDNFAEVERKLIAMLPDAKVTPRWSGQIIETRDGLPYIGETAPQQCVITGFSGNGITFGTVGAMMARDAATGRDNPCRELFDVGRPRVTTGLGTYISENKDYPYYMIRDRLRGDKDIAVSSLRPSEGKTFELDGKHVAAYRADDGEITVLSAHCTHMGCVVTWNQAESSWDCPCHGARFTATGKVMGGPAEEPLVQHKT